jgi:hypothetical protein
MNTQSSTESREANINQSTYKAISLTLLSNSDAPIIIENLINILINPFAL